MANVCQVCDKAKGFGHNVSHSKRRTNRAFQPNVHHKRLTVNGIEMRLKVCTRCMRTLLKPGRV